jgi:broad specificity phosphatase PhoE
VAVEIIFETHAISTDNEAGIASGWLPGRLSARGRELARELGERRRADRPNVVFVSDLTRALETVELAFAGSGIPIRRDPRLRECNYGELNGMPTARLAAERRRRIDEPFPGGQSYREVVEAMRSFLRELAAGWDGKQVVIILHSANRWAIDCLLGGRTLEELVDAPFAWQEGWRYTLPSGWGGPQLESEASASAAAEVSSSPG